MRRVLFIHNGTSGRFRFIAEALRKRGWTGVLINSKGGSSLPGFATVEIPLVKFTRPEDQLFFITNRGLGAGRLVARVAQGLKARGFSPDLIIGHSGWGEMLFLREIFPEARQIQLAEYYYRTRGADVGFDPEFDRPGLERNIRLHADNAVLALSLSEADRIVAPTNFQAKLFPAAFQPSMRIIHEGIDTKRTFRDPDATVIVNGRTLRSGQPVVTFINRYFEPMRGFHVFMRALPRLLEAHQGVDVLIIGSKDRKGYGHKLKDTSWYDWAMKEVGPSLDLDRVHFLGPVDYETLVSCLSISSAHVYLTYPFVLSWSLLDAMACECLVIGSDTEPVREVIQHQRNGLLTNFFDHAALAQRIADVLEKPESYAHLRHAARETVVRHYDRASICDPQWLSLVDELVADATREPRPGTAARALRRLQAKRSGRSMGTGSTLRKRIAPKQ